jgi:hypothetical protein
MQFFRALQLVSYNILGSAWLCVYIWSGILLLLGTICIMRASFSLSHFTFTTWAPVDLIAILLTSHMLITNSGFFLSPLHSVSTVTMLQFLLELSTTVPTWHSIQVICIPEHLHPIDYRPQYTAWYAAPQLIPEREYLPCTNIRPIILIFTFALSLLYTFQRHA